MEKEFVTIDLALRMKALGFDEPCFGAFYDDGKLFIHWNDNVDADELFISQEKCEYYDYECLAPTWQQAFRWFREEYNIYAVPMPFSGKNAFYIQVSGKGALKFDYDTYEEAELACLEKLIEIVENEKML
jgi:hypothetical protein